MPDPLATAARLLAIIDGMHVSAQIAPGQMIATREVIEVCQALKLATDELNALKAALAKHKIYQGPVGITALAMSNKILKHDNAKLRKALAELN